MQRFVATRMFRYASPGVSARSAEVRLAVPGEGAYRRPDPIDVVWISMRGGDPGPRV